jgi:hypothetical protein
MAILDATALQQVLKVQYTQAKVNNLCYPESPVFALMKKETDFGGKVEQVAFQFGSPQARGFAFGVGLGNMSTSLYDAVSVPRVKDYSFAQISGEMIDAAAKDQYSLLNGLKREIDNAMYTCARSIANGLFSAGGGARGQIASTTTLGSTTLQLADPNSVVNFEKNMVLNLSATDGTTGAKRTGTLTVVSVNRDTGALTLNANISTVTGAALLDYVFQNGDFEATRQGITGLPGWLPLVAPVGGDNFFGLDRSQDPTRLAGVRWIASTPGANPGGPIEETLIKCAARLKREGGKPDTVVLNPFDWANLVVAIGSKVVIADEKLPDAQVGVRTITLQGPSGPMKIVSEANCPTGTFFMLTMSTWRFKTLLGAPRILNADGLQMARDATTDSYILRIGYYGNILCDAPGWNAVGTL